MSGPDTVDLDSGGIRSCTPIEMDMLDLDEVATALQVSNRTREWNRQLINYFKSNKRLVRGILVPAVPLKFNLVLCAQSITAHRWALYTTGGHVPDHILYQCLVNVLIVRHDSATCSIKTTTVTVQHSVCELLLQMKSDANRWWAEHPDNVRVFRWIISFEK